MGSERVGRFYDRHAPIYDVTRRFFLPGRRRAVDLLEIRPWHRVMEFGCGTGTNLARIVAAGAADVVGVDLAPAMLREAARKVPAARLVEADMARVELGHVADRVLFSYTLSLLDDWEAALDNARRHLAPDGVCVVVDFQPLRGSARAANRLARAWFRRFHVRTDLPLADAIAARFARVHVESPRWGYATIVRGAARL